MKINWIYKPFNELSLIELYDILVLRQEVFVIEQDWPYLDADGKDLKSHHLMGYNDENELVAYLRLVMSGVSYKEPSLGRIVTSLKYRGTGLGKELMKKSLEKVTEQFGHVPLRISAQCYLEKFYECFGFQPTGKEYLEDGIPHIEMLRS